MKQIQNEDLMKIYEEFKGKGGNPEAESVCVDSKLDKETISIWSSKSDVARIIKRCEKGIISARKLGDGIQFEIDRNYFRGIEYCLSVGN